MINLRTVYKQAEEHATLAIFGLFCILGFLIFLQSIFSPAIVLSLLVSAAAIIISFTRPLWILGALAVYIPFESLVLKFVPDDAYFFARYASEALIYVLVFVVFLRIFSGSSKLKQTILDLPFLLFLFALAASAIINFVEPSVAILGIRQIIRFIIVFFLVANLNPSKSFVRKLTIVMFAVVAFEAGLGILQSFVGESLDVLLLPSEAKALGEITLTAGVSQFWDPGSRIFATLGRYDRLGNFLYFFLLIATGFLFTDKIKENKNTILIFFLVSIPALALTYSRASWFAFILGFLFIGVWIKKDRRVIIGLASFLIVIFSYLAISGLTVRYITESPGQTFSERFFESFSYARWRGEYYGLGRLYWFVQTPARVIPASPIFGHGPGQYGGGAVAALHNTTVYENLTIPFGVFGTEGFIDNNWFSIWGESGTLGFGIYIWMIMALFFYSLKVYRSSTDPFIRSLALGFAACLIGVSFNAFTSTVLEIRSLGFYLWLYAGFVFVLHEQEKLGEKYEDN